MVLTEYNEKEVMESLKKEAYDEGFNAGQKKGIEAAERERKRAEAAEAEVKELKNRLALLEGK